MNKTHCGVDVSKEWLDAGVEPSGAQGRFRNNAAGIAELAAFCREHGVDLVAMEVSGGYERTVFLLLWELGVACAIVNARSVRYFAEAMGFLEKTDKIDAAVIARFAEVKRVKPTPPPSCAQQRLKALVARLSQVTSDLAIQKQRRSAVVDAEILASLDEVIALLKGQQRSLEGEIASLIDDDPLWACLNQAFRSLKGVASRTVARKLLVILNAKARDARIEFANALDTPDSRLWGGTGWGSQTKTISIYDSRDNRITSCRVAPSLRFSAIPDAKPLHGLAGIAPAPRRRSCGGRREPRGLRGLAGGGHRAGDRGAAARRA